MHHTIVIKHETMQRLLARRLGGPLETLDVVINHALDAADSAAERSKRHTDALERQLRGAFNR